TQWTVGALAALALGAMACSTTNSNTKAREPEEAAQGLARESGPAKPALRTVYFDLDSAVLRDEGRTSLSLDAQQIQSNPEWGVVTVQGHCGERGNEEYNLALGEKRAVVVSHYLSDLGVPPDRLKVRSYGEMQPASPGHDERSWRMNRRAQLEI